jgi:ABC transporter with metal-binding/Fe-S-binding domain ATP-binding protein
LDSHRDLTAFDGSGARVLFMPTLRRRNEGGPEDLRVGALFSGGKDSTYAAYVVSKTDQIACLITVFPPSAMSFMFHFPNIRWTSLQAEAMALPQVTGETAGVKEEELGDLRRTIESAKERHDLNAICTGALASVYQKSRVETICRDLGLKCISPLWHADPEAHLRALIRDSFMVEVVSVSALGLGEEWLGRIVDGPAIDQLVKMATKYGFHVGFEGGEGETFVLDCPLFSKRIEIARSEKHWEGDSGYLEITGARLVEKSNPKAEAV